MPPTGTPAINTVKTEEIKNDGDLFSASVKKSDNSTGVDVQHSFWDMRLREPEVRPFETHTYVGLKKQYCKIPHFIICKNNKPS